MLVVVVITVAMVHLNKIIMMMVMVMMTTKINTITSNTRCSHHGEVGRYSMMVAMVMMNIYCIFQLPTLDVRTY